MSNNGQRNKTITVNGRPVVVRELTVGEIGAWLDEKQNSTEDDPLLSLMCVGDMVLGDVLRMTDLKREAVDEMTGSELEEVADCCREVNRHFLALSATLTMASKMVLVQPGEPETLSTD